MSDPWYILVIIVGLFFVITIFSAVIFAVITLFLSGRRNCNV